MKYLLLLTRMADNLYEIVLEKKRSPKNTKDSKDDKKKNLDQEEIKKYNASGHLLTHLLGKIIGKGGSDLPTSS